VAMKASALTRAAVFLCKQLFLIGYLLVQGSDPLTGLGPVARAPPLTSQLSLALTQVAPESVLRVGVLHAHRLTARQWG